MGGRVWTIAAGRVWMIVGEKRECGTDPSVAGLGGTGRVVRKGGNLMRSKNFEDRGFLRALADGEGAVGRWG